MTKVYGIKAFDTTTNTTYFPYGSKLYHTLARATSRAKVHTESTGNRTEIITFILVQEDRYKELLRVQQHISRE